MSTLKFVEELIELLESQLGVHGLSFIFFIQQVHLEVDKALTIALNHRISGSNYKKSVNQEVAYLQT